MLNSRKVISLSLFTLIIFHSLSAYCTRISNSDLNSFNGQQISIEGQADVTIEEQVPDFKDLELIYNLLSTANKETGLSPDYWGTDQYSDYASVAHKMLDALAYNAVGYQQQAEKILDYFADRLDINKAEINEKKDTTNIYGILKIISDESTALEHIGIVDGISISNTTKSGKAQSSFNVTPRTISLLISAMLKINRNKYRAKALQLGETLLAFQDKKSGAFIDSDRISDYTHTDEHLAAYSALVMLSQIDADEKWTKAADNAYFWFTTHTFNSSLRQVFQGYGKDGENKTFTTSAYTHFFLSPAADKLSISLIKAFTDTVLKNSLCTIALSLPDNRWIQTTMADEYNPQDPKVIEARGALHPRASLEQTIYLIMMLQKNAVRLKNHNLNAAKYYKTIAEILIQELKKTYYKVDTLRGFTSFAFSSQNTKFINLGANHTAMIETVSSPYFYIENTNHPKDSIKGASSISAMLSLLNKGINPFTLEDDYLSRYQSLNLRKEDKINAINFLKHAIKHKVYSEETPTETELSIAISEPEKYNKEMWKHFSDAEKFKLDGDAYKSRRSYENAQEWALKTVNNARWYLLAVTDNNKKAAKFDGIIEYPFGIVFPENESSVHTAIMRYPVLNEMGAAMWALATISYEFGDRQESKKWIKKLIENIPLHQIPSVQTNGDQTGLINGYWNALEAWEDNPRKEVRDQKMHTLYMEVLKEMDLESAKPKKIKL